MPSPLKFFRKGVKRLGLTGYNHHVRALFGQRLRHRPAKATARAYYHSYSVFQV